MQQAGLRESQAPISGGRTPPVSESFLKNKQITIASTPYNSLFPLYVAFTGKSTYYLTKKVKRRAH